MTSIAEHTMDIWLKTRPGMAILWEGLDCSINLKVHCCTTIHAASCMVAEVFAGLHEMHREHYAEHVAATLLRAGNAQTSN